MMTEEQIEKAFGKWFQESWDCDYDGHIQWHFNQRQAYLAAFALLIPVIEKLQESNDTYAQSPENGYLARQNQQQVREMLGNLIKEEI